MTVCVMRILVLLKFVHVYHESMNRELQRRPKYECRCDERLKTKVEGSTSLSYTEFVWGTGTPKDRDEVNRREVCECDG